MSTKSLPKVLVELSSVDFTFNFNFKKGNAAFDYLRNFVVS